MTQFKYIDASQRIVSRVNEDGSYESHLATASAVQQYIVEGGSILPPDAPVVDRIGGLMSIDTKSVRAIRAILLAQALGKSPDPKDIEQLNNYEQQATSLRNPEEI